nr:FAD-binding oxidoreductase [uncultured Sphingomonas sp.]
MSAACQKMITAVRAELGDKAVVMDPMDIEPWLTDWRGRWTGRSPAILQPATTSEAAVMVRLSNAYGVPLVPQGGNTSMVGGATPSADGDQLILSLRRMNHIRSINPVSMRCIAEAGVILQTLHDAVAAEGLRFPLTLGSRGSATVGGLASTNAGGTQVLRHGPMRSLIEGVEAVLPDGSIHNGLSGLKKDNRGYSIDQMMVGAEGTLGIITAVRLKLEPAIKGRAVAWLGVESPQAALDTLRALERKTSRIEGFEILPNESLQAALAQIAGTRAPLESEHPWHVLVEAVTDDDDRQTADALLERLLAPLIGETVGDAVIAANETQAEAFWKIRDSLSEAEKKQYGPATQHDISVPVERMPTFMVDAARDVEREFPGTRASGFGHLGDGNVHFHVRAGTRGGPDWLASEGPSVTRYVDDLVTAAGGSISAEHGIGQMKRDELQRINPQRTQTLRALKFALDPKGLMNPGKLI